MLASNPASILNHNSPIGGIPSDSINLGNALAVCGGDLPQPHFAIAALLGRFLPRLGPLVETQEAFLFVYAVTSATIPRQHRFQSTTRPSCLLLLKQGEND
jgi:hypothetical protein